MPCALLNISTIFTFGGSGPQMQAAGHVLYPLHDFFSCLAALRIRFGTLKVGCRILRLISIPYWPFCSG